MHFKIKKQRSIASVLDSLKRIFEGYDLLINSDSIRIEFKDDLDRNMFNKKNGIKLESDQIFYGDSVEIMNLDRFEEFWKDNEDILDVYLR